MRILWIAVSGALGATARYLLEGVVSRRYPGAFPLGTFVVNMSGSFLLGFVFVVLTDRFAAPPILRTAITIGFIGAYTTFSTLSFETLRMVQDGAVTIAVLNALGSVVFGLVAVYVGSIAGRAL